LTSTTTKVARDRRATFAPKFLAQVADFQRLKTDQNRSKSPENAGFSRKKNDHNPRSITHVAGDAVLIAPVSGQIPCKQGILQGNVQF